MAFFKFRKAGGDASGAAVQTESVEVLRRRARHRLIGAAVLVGAAVIGFPLLFDTQPRPVSVDIPIDIPDRDKARPLVVAPAPASTSAAPASSPGTAVAAAPAAMAASEALGPREEIVPRKPAASAPAAAASSAARSATGAVSGGAVAESKPAAKPAETKPAESKAAESRATEPKAAASKPAEASRTATRTDDGAKALALLEGKQPEAAAGRFVVQVGAFAEPDKAREVRLKLERAGLKTYTHVAETKEGKRIRVRVGPFDNKAEADKAAERIKALDLPAAILTL